uniref:Uncharacterized protein n=1 Tax=Anguilla anguilla TaxID=7936 RepID=A0A0E9QB27_ANGAN
MNFSCKSLASLSEV